MSLAAGSRLGVYEIGARIGAGGMGEVYRARDPRLGRDVAIKVLAPAIAADPDRLARFEREARALAALSHPNILAIHDVGIDNGIAYAVTDLLEGLSLADVLRAGALPRRKALDYARQIAQALEASHARGIVHRDLKPANVFVSPSGRVTVLDFGLAAVQVSPADHTHATTTHATSPGAVMGTPGYMSPEQVRGEVADHRSDIFSFGCVLYEMLAGRRAFQGESAVDALHATLRAEPRELAAMADVPVALSRLVGRCLEKDPAERMQSARDLVFALETAHDARPRGRPRVVPIAAAVAVVALLATAVVVWVTVRDRAAPAAPRALAAPRGIAVLPFVNLAGPDQAYFVDGVTEEVTLQIAKVGALRVMSRAAVLRFKDGLADLPAMTRELGVGAVLTGSVRHADRRVRVGVQLLAAPSGETLWSEQYDGDLGDVLAVQANIALRVARALQASLAPEERARIERLPTGSADAYDLYLKSQTLHSASSSDIEAAIARLERAIALDPRFALAHAALAAMYYQMGVRAGSHFERGVVAARTALEIDSELAPAHFALGVNLAALGRRDEGRQSIERATLLDPNMVVAMNELAILETNAGRLDLALYWAKRAFLHAPNMADSYFHVAIPLSLIDNDVAGRFTQAAAARFPLTTVDGVRPQLLLAVIEWRKGQPDQAMVRLRGVMRAYPQHVEGRLTLTEMAVLTEAHDAAGLTDRAITDGLGDGYGLYSPYTPRVGRAFLFSRAGDRARAEPIVDTVLAAGERALASENQAWGPLMQRAAALLMRGDRPGALDALDAAERAGWTDALFLARDPLLALLRGEPRLTAIMQRIERRVAEMRGRSDFRNLDDWAGERVTTP